MIILSNDYPTNLPGSDKPAKGGPANFAKRFKEFLRGDHHWIGLIVSFPLVKSPSIKSIREKGQCRYYHLSVPLESVRTIEHARKNLDTEIIFEKSINKISSLLRKTKPDVIFLNGYAVSNWLLLKAAQKEKIPIVVQHAGVWTKELEMYHDFYSKTGQKLLAGMENELSEIVDAEIFLNSWSRRYYDANVVRTDKRKSHIIPLPLDFDSYKNSLGRKKPNDTLNIGIVARWDRIKNHEAIANLAEQAMKDGLPWKFHSVTVIPDTNKKKQLKDLYRKNIKIVPPLTQNGIKRFCQKMDLVILPSHFDVSPNIVLEAIGCGTSVAISKNVGFVDDFKENDAKGWIIDFNLPKSAIKKISKIANRPMPLILSKKLISKHQSSKVFLTYIKLFQNLIKPHENRPT
jgi:glycosyltransferase involved in cell wall biosynthesis